MVSREFVLKVNKRLRASSHASFLLPLAILFCIYRFFNVKRKLEHVGQYNESHPYTALWVSGSSSQRV